MERLIFHCDGNNFFASCECLRCPELKSVPMAVAGDPEFRTGVVVAKNEAAKRYGVKTTDTVAEAKRKCPNIVFVPPHHDLYAQISGRINTIYRSYTPLVEPASIDESYLDMTGTLSYYAMTATQLADTIRVRVRSEIGITISVGVSYNKVFAKMGSDYKKPDATTWITEENFRQLLWPLPVGEMQGVGKSAQKLLMGRCIRTIGDLANTEKSALERLLGKWGGELWCAANGLDDSPVISEQEQAKSVSRGMTFRRDLRSEREVQTGLAVLAQDVAAALRKENLAGSVVQVQIKSPQLNSFSRQTKLERPTNLQKDIQKTAFALLKAHWAVGLSPIRALTVSVTQLCLCEEREEQLSFWNDIEETQARDKSRHVRQEKLEQTMFAIRKRYGADAISLGVIENEEIGVHSGIDSGAWAETAYAEKMPYSQDDGQNNNGI